MSRMRQNNEIALLAAYKQETEQCFSKLWQQIDLTSNSVTYLSLPICLYQFIFGRDHNMEDRGVIHCSHV